MIKEILFKKISPNGLSVFRIAYCLVFLSEVIRIFNYRQLYYDTLPFLNPHFPDISALLILWMVIIVFLILGFLTRIMTIVNYIFTLVFISSAVSYEYHMFYVYSGVNFMLIFLPIYSSISIDALRKKISCLRQGFLYVRPKVSKLNYLIPIFIALGLVYFDSVIFYKLESPMWLRGLGLWLPSSLPQVTISDNQWLLNKEYLIKFFSYLTMYFEFIFIFLFWNKRFRLPLLIIGIGLHIGIVVEYPIPHFGWGCATIYLLMVPVSFWEKLSGKLFRNKEIFTIYYDKSNIYSREFQMIVQSLDIFNRIKYEKINTTKSSSLDKNNNGAFTYGVDLNENKYSKNFLMKKIVKVSPFCFFIVFLDTLFIYKNPLRQEEVIDERSGMLMNFVELKDQNYQTRSIITNGILVMFFFVSCLAQIQVHYSFFDKKETTLKVDRFLVEHFGICKHPVFMDMHFRGYSNVYGIKYKDSFLPLLNEKGMPGNYLSGATWVNWTWRVNSPYVSKSTPTIRKGLVEYSSFWSHKNKIDLSEKQEFEIVRKKIRVPFEWEEDLLQNNIDSPWEKVGNLIWENETPKLIWN